MKEPFFDRTFSFGAFLYCGPTSSIQLSICIIPLSEGVALSGFFSFILCSVAEPFSDSFLAIYETSESTSSSVPVVETEGDTSFLTIFI